MARWVVPAGWLLGIGWYFATCVVLGVLAGRWLDGRFETAPLFALIGTFAGLAAALYGGYRTLTERLLRPHSSAKPAHSGPAAQRNGGPPEESL